MKLSKRKIEEAFIRYLEDEIGLSTDTVNLPPKFSGFIHPEKKPLAWIGRADFKIKDSEYSIRISGLKIDIWGDWWESVESVQIDLY